jgi:hypothetical protein
VIHEELAVNLNMHQISFVSFMNLVSTFVTVDDRSFEKPSKEQGYYQGNFFYLKIDASTSTR